MYSRQVVEVAIIGLLPGSLSASRLVELDWPTAINWRDCFRVNGLGLAMFLEALFTDKLTRCRQNCNCQILKEPQT